MIKAILHDAVGTLIQVTGSVAAVYADAAARHGSRLPLTEIERRFMRAFARQEQIDAETGWRTSEARERQRWQDIVSEVIDDVADPKACFELLFETFGRAATWTVDADAAEVLAAARRRSFRQAVASNFDRRLHGLIGAMPDLGAHLDGGVHVSSEIGWRKPAPQFFAHMVKALNLEPAEILFVGDDRRNDFEPASQAGMQSILFDPRRNHLDLTAQRIERLRELMQWPQLAD